jgi:hypothetical protein
MKKAAFSILVLLFTCCIIHAKAQPHSYSTHPHDHLSYSIDTVLNDANGSGRVVLDVTLTVDLSGHPECTIASTSMYINYETWDDHWVLVDETSIAPTFTRTIEYNVHDRPYWLAYYFDVQYTDGTSEEEGLDVYF